MNSLLHSVRILAVGLLFFSFGMGAVALSLLVFPCLRLWPGDRVSKRIRIQRTVHYNFRIFVWVMRLLGLVKVEASGLQYLRTKEPKIIVANHPTLLDIVVLLSYIPYTDCIAKNALWKNPFLRGVVRAAEYINNDDATSLIEICINRIKAGSTLLLFPEGTRTPADGRLYFKKGAAYVALEGNCPILPVTIQCQPRALTNFSGWHVLPRRMVRFKLNFGAPIQPESLVRGVENKRERATFLTWFLEKKLQKEVLNDQFESGHQAAYH